MKGERESERKRVGEETREWMVQREITGKLTVGQVVVKGGMYCQLM